MKKIAVLLVLLMIMPLLGCVTNAQIKNYNAGVAAFDAGSMEEARRYFEAAGSYGNSKSYLSAITEYESIYLDALRLFDAHDYPAARNSFSAITSFENAQEYIDLIDRLEIRYNEGMEAYKQLDYPLAKQRFVQAMGYSDAADYVTAISRLEDNYHLAMSFLAEDSPLEALRALLKIGTAYRDTLERIDELYAFFDNNGLTAKEYIALYIESHTASGESAAVPSLDLGETGFAARTSDEVLITGNTGKDGRIRNVSFWLPDSAAEEMGEKKTALVFAHCLHAFTVNRVKFKDFYDEIDAYMNGEKGYADYTFSMRHDASGFKVLTAVRNESAE
ncbi:MAG: hypothetical protein K6G56_02575 [Clostridiales bacterium]|nr:hypothetical protein [Clostridiales bacterium]